MKSKLITALKTLLNTSALIAILVFTLTSCATIDGAGQDIESAGEVVQDAANE
ncbi:entericidin A/B family lipoprotein [uncultured Paraglaciecola sp.]|uniref:entericidin A/B family lipoprotein n=1 Tax=uncultured Paraglaciecola sp. TaxID=1765024 RepID=UPI0030D83496|tara:strand:- start:11142 stop:11300 length:159 start_codon:yes stop_codon:yes gene_type:complete